MQSEVKHCEACSSEAVALEQLRADLAYWICDNCGHCLMSTTGKSIDDFEKAQSAYFGESSILIQHEASVIDQEILAQRKRTLSAYVVEQGTVLEVGPGAGFVAEWLQKCGHGLRLVEHSPVLADNLEKKLGVPVEIGAFETSEIAPASVAAFCSFHVIEHVPDPMRHLMAGLLAVREGGIGFVATPNACSWQQTWFRKLSPNFDTAHLRVFSPDSLRMFCERAGWEVVRIETPEYAVGWLRVFSKVVRRLRGEDENLTAGKYADMASVRLERIYKALAVLTWPLRCLQLLAGRGNEVLLILRKPLVHLGGHTSVTNQCDA